MKTLAARDSRSFKYFTNSFLEKNEFPLFQGYRI